MEQFIAACCYDARDEVYLSECDTGFHLELFNSKGNISADVVVDEDGATKLYEWLGQALGKHPAGVKG